MPLFPRRKTRNPERDGVAGAEWLRHPTVQAASPPWEPAAHVPAGLEPSWYKPIVVDQPVVEFEPRAPARSVRPDTICDGWATGDFTVRTAAVRGYDHRYHGVPRQDEVIVQAHPATRGVVFAVADGVSAASHAEIGADLACGTSVSALSAALDEHPPADVPWDDVLHYVARRLTLEAARISRLPEPDQAQVERLVATTLVAGFIVRDGHDTVARLVQIGDSCAWLLRQGQFQPLLRHKTDNGSSVLSSAVEPLPRVPAGLRPMTVVVPPDAALVVATDGLGDPLGDGSGLVGRMFADALLTPPSPLGLARLLDFSRETFDDDRAVAVIWPARNPRSSTGSKGDHRPC